MGIASYLIASALTAVVGQRLVRQICPQCKSTYKPNRVMLKSIGLPETTKNLYKGAGCEHCYHTGSKGRTGIFEIFEVTPELRKMIATEKPVEQLAKEAKLKNMADRCKLKVMRGEVAPEEYLRVIRL
jgi:type II secretory ATPase GspE/PulE/Tfp pilus assembly ATPase PilB-like protein